MFKGMKGTTKIELFDAETGELINTVEDSNLITNGFAELCKPILETSPFLDLASAGGADNVINTLPTNIARFLYMGLLLFDKALPEDPNLLYKPSGVNNIGCGINQAYGGANPFYCSLNSLDSQLDPRLGYVKYVWDANASQCNGTIECACLTTEQGARASAGIGSIDAGVAGVWNGNISRSNHSVVPPGARFQQAKYILHVDYEENCIYRIKDTSPFRSNYSGTSHFANTKKITVEKYRIPLNDISIFDRFLTSTTPQGLVETIDFDMPIEIANTIDSNQFTTQFRYPHGISNHEGHTYFHFFKPNSAGTGADNVGSIAPGGDILIWDMDLINKTSSLLKVKNTTGETIQSRGQVGLNRIDVTSSQSHAYPIVILKDCTIVITTSGNMYVINNTDNTDVKQVKNMGGTNHNVGGNPFSNSEFFSILDSMEQNGNLLFRRGETGNSPNQDRVFSLDLQTGVMSLISSTPSGVTGSSSANEPRGGLVFNKNSSIYLLGLRNNSGGTTDAGILSIVVNPAILMTINNLPEPVVKTSAQTMRVTYTLTNGVMPSS